MEEMKCNEIRFVDQSDNKAMFRDKVRQLADELGISFKMFYADGATLTCEQLNDNENIKLIDKSINEYSDTLNNNEKVVKKLCTYLGNPYVIWDCKHVDNMTVYSLVPFIKVILHLYNADPFSREEIKSLINTVTVEDGADNPIELTSETLEFEKQYELKSI